MAATPTSDEGQAGKEGAFEPKVLTFCCNWCSYAGADLAGVSRFQYPTNSRIIRVMCAGMVDPIYIMKAFEQGIDGVLITGCHPGDCHYISGNLQAKERLDHTAELLQLVGIEPGRFKLEWVSASEGQRFAELQREFVEQVRKLGPIATRGKVEQRQEIDLKASIKELIDFTAAQNCVACGKCTGVCPVPNFKPDFAPRLLVVKATAGVREQLVEDRDVWDCVTCEMCNAMCPYNVDFSGFIRGMRGIVGKQGGFVPECSQAGLLLGAQRLMTTEGFKPDRLGWLSEPESQGLKFTHDKGKVFYFVGCLPHMRAAYHHREGLRLVDIARASVKLMNAVGIEPVISPRELCCGHDLNWIGEEENMQKLMLKNVETIRSSGAEKVVFGCPEGLRTFQMDYQDFMGDFEFELLHVTQLLADQDIALANDKETTFTYHDPCRLGRHLGIYDPPRELIKKIPNAKLVEMAHAREEGVCCGVSAWATCDCTTMKMQTDRLQEAVNAGADYLLTSCPKCWIHLDCAREKTPLMDHKDLNLKIEDLIITVARYLR